MTDEVAKFDGQENPKLRIKLILGDLLQILDRFSMKRTGVNGLQDLTHIAARVSLDMEEVKRAVGEDVGQFTNRFRSEMASIIELSSQMEAEGGRNISSREWKTLHESIFLLLGEV